MNAHATDIRAAIPVNIEAEQALLGAILQNNEVFGLVAGFLDAAHFTEPVHRRLYDVIGDVIRAGRKANPITLKDYLPVDLEIGDMSGYAYCVKLFAETPTVVNGPDYARSIHDLALRRELIAIGEDMATWARGAAVHETPAAQISDAESRLFDLARKSTKATHQAASMVGHLADAIMQEIEDDTVRVPPTSTGLKDLDHLIGGYRPGNLVILAGRPGMAKTTVAASSALAVAQRDTAVLFFSADMPSKELAARMVSDLAWTSTEPLLYESILNGTVRGDRHKGLARIAAQTLRGLPMMIDPQQGLTIAELCLRARRRAENSMRKGRKLGLIVVDHLGKIRPSGDRRNDSRHLELGDITNALVDLAGELDTTVLCLCQLNRAVEARENKRPMLSDLRESGRIEEDAACVIGLYREAYYLANQTETDPEKEVKRTERLHERANDLDAIVMKNRHGALGVAKLWIHAGAGAVRDREWRH